MDTPHPPDSPRRPHDPDPLKAYLEFDLSADVDRLRDEPVTGSGRQARTLAKYGGLRVVLMTLRSSAQIAEHQTAGAISVHVLSGHVRVHALGRTFDLTAGRLLSLAPEVRHSLEAVSESALLVTIGG